MWNENDVLCGMMENNYALCGMKENDALCGMMENNLFDLLLNLET